MIRINLIICSVVRLSEVSNENVATMFLVDTLVNRKKYLIHFLSQDSAKQGG